MLVTFSVLGKAHDNNATGNLPEGVLVTFFVIGKAHDNNVTQNRPADLLVTFFLSQGKHMTIMLHRTFRKVCWSCSLCYCNNTWNLLAGALVTFFVLV